jgi:23S rRNA pseudouridine1911/1915/1917 synthase
VPKLVIPIDLAGERLDRALARLLPGESRSRLARLIDEGHVRVEGRDASASLKMKSGESVDVALEPRRPRPRTCPRRSRCPSCTRTRDVLVVDKPAAWWCTRAAATGRARC